jgi:hypothetical protein
MSRNRLKMNPDKTEFILFGGPQQMSKCSTQGVKVCDTVVDKSPVIKFVGAYLDSSLNMKKHIQEVTRTCNATLRNVIKIRKFLTHKALTQLVMGLVVSRLDYANSLFAGLPASTIKPLKDTHHFAAKVITYRRKGESNTAALRELHWLPIEARVKFKVLTFVYKCLKGLSPKYLSSLIQVKNATRVTRGSARQNLVVPRVKYTTFAGRSFAVIGPQLWNNLPDAVRQSEDFSVFKSKLKTYLFSQFFK